MKRTLLVILALVMALTLVIGSLSTASAAPPVKEPVTGVSLNKSSVVIEVGGNYTLTATITPGNATNQKVSWSSSNKKVATVVSTGPLTALVTGKSQGTATITVKTADGRLKASCSTTVGMFAEDFTGVSLPNLPAGWTTSDSSLCYSNPSNFAGGVSPELYLNRLGAPNVYGDYYVSSPAIDATGVTGTLALSFKHVINVLTYNALYPYTIAVDISTNGGSTWTNVWQLGTLVGSVGPKTEIMGLSAYKGNTINIRWHLSGYTGWLNFWAIDDIAVYEY